MLDLFSPCSDSVESLTGCSRLACLWPSSEVRQEVWRSYQMLQKCTEMGQRQSSNLERSFSATDSNEGSWRLQGKYVYCIYYQLLGNCSKGGELFRDTSKKYRFRSRALEPCTAQCFMKVKADVPLSNFYKVYRFDSILNDSFSARCTIVCSGFFNGA